MQPINATGNSPVITSNQKTDGCYVLNSNNEKFKCTMSPTRKQNANFIDGNRFAFIKNKNFLKLVRLFGFSIV